MEKQLIDNQDASVFPSALSFFPSGRCDRKLMRKASSFPRLSHKSQCGELGSGAIPGSPLPSRVWGGVWSREDAQGPVRLGESPGAVGTNSSPANRQGRDAQH